MSRTLPVRVAGLRVTRPCGTTSAHLFAHEVDRNCRFSTMPVVVQDSVGKLLGPMYPIIFPPHQIPRLLSRWSNVSRTFLHFSIDTTELSTAGIHVRYKSRQAVAENPQMAAYVRQLEAREQQEEGFEIGTGRRKGNGGGNGHANGKTWKLNCSDFLHNVKQER